MSRKVDRKSRDLAAATKWERERTRSLIAKLRAGTLVPLAITAEGEVEIGPAPLAVGRLPAKLRRRELTAVNTGRLDHYRLVPVPKRPTPEEHEMMLDMLVAHGGLVTEYGPDGKLVKSSTRPPPGKSWRELLVDGYNARQPDEIRRFRQKYGLRVTARELEEVREAIKSSRAFWPPVSPRGIGPELRTRYATRRVRWGGVAVIYAALLHELGIRPTRERATEPQPQAAKGTVILQQREGHTARASAAVAPVGAVCVYCDEAFLPRGTVRDCCPNPACRRARKNAQKRTWYAEHREQEVRRVMRAQRQARRARRA